MYNRDKFLEQERIIEEIYYDFFKSKGYYTHINDDIETSGYGGYAVKEDRFAVIFELIIFPYPKEFMISVKDRNGSQVIYGESAANYSYSPSDEVSDEEIKEKFQILLNDVYSKYKIYSRDNRLDFVYNNLKVENKDYTNIKLLDLKQSKNEIDEEIEK